MAKEKSSKARTSTAKKRVTAATATKTVTEGLPKKGIRDLDFRDDFDAETGEVTDPKIEKHYADERKKLLGDPVGSGKAADAYPIEAPPVSKAAAKTDAKAPAEGSGDTSLKVPPAGTSDASDTSATKAASEKKP